jgi:ATP-dependent DNA ligase
MNHNTAATEAVNYKRKVSNAFIPLCPADIDARVSGTQFCVTRKYDGEMILINIKEESCGIINSSGNTVDAGMPAMREFTKCLDAANIECGVFIAELYVDESKGRARVGDVRAALADESKKDTLRFAPFDIISIDDKDWRPASYAETWQKLSDIFAKASTCAPVRMKNAASKADIKEIFAEWVEQEGAEGIVVRSELPLVYKIKPKYSLDCAVIGFSESETKGRIRTLLLALMREDGSYQRIGRSGGGLSEEQRTSLYKKLIAAQTPSNYLESDSNHVAFRMVKPEIVVEVSGVDITSENSSGPTKNPLLVFDEKGWRGMQTVPGISIIAPVIERIRDDKKINKDDIRAAQIAGFINLADSAKSRADLPKSELLKREVYKKESGGKIMALKFLVWKTNKETADADYPAYVFSYTNFSSERAEPLQTEMRISGDQKQIMQLCEDSIAKNVKKGWEKV